MRFEYTGIISSAADTGEPAVIFRPEIEITIHGPKGAREVLALVDTGSDDTVLSERVARDLGIPLARGTGPAARVFGGQEVSLFYADVELELVHADGRLRWLAHVHFLAGGSDEASVVLGHQGFLEFFTAKFSGEECALDLEPNAYLPRVG